MLKYNDLFENYDNEKITSLYEKLREFLIERDFSFFDSEDSFESKFQETCDDSDLSAEEKAENLTSYLDETYGIYNIYSEVYEYIRFLFES